MTGPPDHDLLLSHWRHNFQPLNWQNSILHKQLEFGVLNTLTICLWQYFVSQCCILLSHFCTLGLGSVFCAAFHTSTISLYVESRDNREQNTCLSSSVTTPTAFGIMRAVFSLLISSTDTVGISICNRWKDSFTWSTICALIEYIQNNMHTNDIVLHT